MVKKFLSLLRSLKGKIPFAKGSLNNVVPDEDALVRPIGDLGDIDEFHTLNPYSGEFKSGGICLPGNIHFKEGGELYIKPGELEEWVRANPSLVGSKSPKIIHGDQLTRYIDGNIWLGDKIIGTY